MFLLLTFGDINNINHLLNGTSLSGSNNYIVTKAINFSPNYVK